MKNCNDSWLQGSHPWKLCRPQLLIRQSFSGWKIGWGRSRREKLADLVLLDANPLDDIRNTQKIAAVIVNGRYFSRADLDKMLARVEKVASGK